MQPTWANVQVHRAYPDYVMEFDRLDPDDDVRWAPYGAEVLSARAPNGLSTLCMRDSQYWLTRKTLVFDVLVEEYSPRVMRQFGLHQTFPFDMAVLFHRQFTRKFFQLFYNHITKSYILCSCFT